MTPHRPRPLCAICADREATTITDWESRGVVRMVPACGKCASTAVAAPRERFEPVAHRAPRTDLLPSWNHDTRNAIVSALRRMGPSTSRQLAAELGSDDRGALALIYHHLGRLVACGTLAREDVDAGRVYRVVGATMTPRLASAMATLEALPDAFRSDEIARAARVDGNKLAGLLRVLSTEGLIEKVKGRNTKIVAGRCVTRPSEWRKTEQARRAA